MQLLIKDTFHLIKPNIVESEERRWCCSQALRGGEGAEPTQIHAMGRLESPACTCTRHTESGHRRRKANAIARREVAHCGFQPGLRKRRRPPFREKSRSGCYSCCRAEKTIFRPFFYLRQASQRPPSPATSPDSSITGPKQG